MNIRHTQKYLKFSNHKNIVQICTLTLKKPQIDRNDSPKRQKIIILSYPKHIYFSDLPDPALQKNVMQNFEHQKIDWTYLYMIIWEYHHTPRPSKLTRVLEQYVAKYSCLCFSVNQPVSQPARPTASIS